MMSRYLGVAMILATACLASPAYSQSATSAAALACVKSAVMLPLLGGRGDSPIIPATVNGHDVAFYVSVGFKGNFIHNAGSLWFPAGGSGPLKAEDGETVSARPTVLETVQLGGIELDQLPATMLDGDAKHAVGSRPILGVLGREMFRGVQMLLDEPHRKLALFRWKSDDPRCSDSGRMLLGDDAFTTHMDRDAMINVSIGKHSNLMQINSDLEESVMPLGTAYDDGASDAELAQDDKMLVKYARTVISSDHRFHDISLGGYRIPAMNFLVQGRISFPAIGNNFFERAVVLVDFPHGRIAFKPTDDRDDTPPLHLHFNELIEGRATVHERQGAVQ